MSLVAATADKRFRRAHVLSYDVAVGRDRSERKLFDAKRHPRSTQPSRRPERSTRPTRR